MNEFLTRPIQGGRFPLLLDNQVHQVALGNMSQFCVLLHTDPEDGSLWVGVMGAGCYRFGQYAHANYVQDKLRVLPGDAGNFADFINSQLDMSWYEWEPQGKYDDHLLHPRRVGDRVKVSTTGTAGLPLVNKETWEVVDFSKPLEGLGISVHLRNTRNQNSVVTVPLYELVSAI